MLKAFETLKRRLDAARDDHRRAEMAKMGLDPFEQDAAITLMAQLDHGTPQEKQDALIALRLLVESGELRQG